MWNPDTPSKNSNFCLILPLYAFSFKTLGIADTFTCSQTSLPTRTHHIKYPHGLRNCVSNSVKIIVGLIIYPLLYTTFMCKINVWFFTCGPTETHAMCEDTRDDSYTT